MQLRREAIALVGCLALVGCGSDEPETTTAAKTTNARTTSTSETLDNLSGPIGKASEYADERYDKPTDDNYAAALSGCYLGLTGEYLGPPGLTANTEYPEPELRVILDRAERACR